MKENKINKANIWKILSHVLVVILAGGLLAGCTNKATGEKNDSENRLIHVVDAYGNTIEVGSVEKAVVFDFGILDIMTYANIEVELALPISSLPSYLSQYQAAQSAGSIKEPDMEAIFEFEPDVILISTRQASFYEELSKIAPTIFVDLQAASFMDDFKRNADIVGTLFDKQEIINKGIDEINALIDETKQLALSRNDKALIILTNDGSISAYGSGSRFGLVHDVIGLQQADENIAVSTHGQEASFEYISQVNPDLLFVIDRTQVVGGTTEGSSTLDNDLVNATKAAMNHKIIYLNPEAWYLSSGGVTSLKTMIAEVKQSIE